MRPLFVGRFIEARDETNSPVGQAEKRETKGKSGTKYHTITRAQKIGVAPLKGGRQGQLEVAATPRVWDLVPRGSAMPSDFTSPRAKALGSVKSSSIASPSVLGPIRGGSPPPLAVLASALSGGKRDFCALVGKNPICMSTNTSAIWCNRVRKPKQRKNRGDYTQTRQSIETCNF